MSNSRGRTLLIVMILLSAVLLAAGNVLCHALVVQELTGSAPPAEPGVLQQIDPRRRPGGRPAPAFRLVLQRRAAPGRRRFSPCSSASMRGGATPAGGQLGRRPIGTSDGALRLLALLQQEGRLVDFLEEDIEPYNDAQVGAAVRAIHAGCRKALHERMRIERIYGEEDGASVEVAVRLRSRRGAPHRQRPRRSRPSAASSSTAAGAPSEVTLPKTAGVDAAILAPAEVEIA